MSTLDTRIRRELARVVNKAPMAPSIAELLSGPPPRWPHRLDRRRLVLGAAAMVGLILVAGNVLVGRVAGQLEADVDESETGGGSAGVGQVLEFDHSSAMVLDLPRVVNVGLPMASDGSTLYAGFTGSIEGPTAIVELADPDTAPVVSLDSGPTGVASDVVAEGGTVMVVVSRHLQDRAPAVLVSKDAGTTWDEHRLPLPPGLESHRDGATGAAIGSGRLIVSGRAGVWVFDGSGWQYVEVAGRNQKLTTIGWDGTGFIAGGGQLDPLSATRPDDYDLMIWRSPDGIEWSQPELVDTDPSIRTGNGIGQLATRGGRTITITNTQQWEGDRPEGDRRGTIVTASTGDKPTVAKHYADWIFHYAVATDSGFVTSAQSVSDPTRLRFLTSDDGLTWRDSGQASAVMMSGATWRNGLVLNGYKTDGDPSSTWFLAPSTPAEVDAATQSTPPARHVTPSGGPTSIGP